MVLDSKVVPHQTDYNAHYAHPCQRRPSVDNYVHTYDFQLFVFEIVDYESVLKRLVQSQIMRVTSRKNPKFAQNL